MNPIQLRSRSIHTQEREIKNLSKSNIGELIRIKFDNSAVRAHQLNHDNMYNAGNYDRIATYFCARRGFGQSISELFGEVQSIDNQVVKLVTENRKGGYDLHEVNKNAVRIYERYL